MQTTPTTQPPRSKRKGNAKGQPKAKNKAAPKAKEKQPMTAAAAANDAPAEAQTTQDAAAAAPPAQAQAPAQPPPLPEGQIPAEFNQRVIAILNNQAPPFDDPVSQGFLEKVRQNVAEHNALQQNLAQANQQVQGMHNRSQYLLGIIEGYTQAIWDVEKRKAPLATNATPATGDKPN